jgi:hypothetical protein
LESILDDCLALSMPSKYLLWHYRSKHESLIAFSNSEYYDNKLLTFPSPDNIESKVRLVPVNGFYDKGKTRQNKAEAKAVIDEITKRLLDENLRKRSMGVITFSSVQQAIIEDMLSDLFIAKPELETLALECDEPLFIKNLENVQGDERDVILFSIGYGPDANGNVSMNFGPLNRLGGERRLNVAVSRARYEMIIYSTLKSDQIDLNRTSSVGVAGLKRFLEYAGKGTRKVTDVQNNVNEIVSIANAIAKELKKQGYIVHLNIGCSGYKINLGIVDTNNTSKYILGILCDGENYRKTKTAGDREIVQNSVLRLLGWNIFRIWTIDWWENPQAVLDAVTDAVQQVKSNTKPVDIEPIHIVEKEQQLSSRQNIESEINLKPEKIGVGNQINSKYHSAILKPSGYSSEVFLFPEHKNRILSQIREVIETESPVSRSLVCKRVLSSWNISRLGQRLDAYFEQLFRLLPYYQIKHEGFVFFWLSEEHCRQYSQYRPDSERDANDLPPEEIANGIKQIVEEQISLPTPDLTKIAAQLFGFARTGTHVDAAMHRGISEAVRRDFIKTENGRAIVK